ncbi:MAG: molybdopterin-dependent oxidoreductase [Oligoflexia bacterium]|nr:molybdopterin-dependent oxidoreductase [Oligoflexia bacterium]
MPLLHTCPLCEALCGIEIDHDSNGRLTVRGDPQDPLSRGHICPKAAALPDLQDDPDRVRAPLRRQGSGWISVSWDSAMTQLAERIHRAQRDFGQNALGVYIGSPNVHHYDNLLALLVMGRVFQTHNRFSASSVDQLPQLFSQWAMLGNQSLFPVPDLDRTDHLLILGANPAVSNGSIMTAPGVMKRLAAIRSRGGCVVVVDPRRTRTAQAADRHVPLRPGTDPLLLLAMVHVIFAEGRVDDGAWRSFCDGLDRLEAAAAPWTPQRVATLTGIAPDQIRRLAVELVDAPRAALYCRVGSCTQRFGGLSTWLALALNIITGNLDRPGGMMFTTPAADMPALAARFGWLGHTGAWRSRAAGLPEFGDELPACAMASELELPGEDQVKVLLTVAGNPVLSTPNGTRLARALDGLDFMASLDLYINETSSHANLILPPPPPLSRDHYGLVFHTLAVHNTARYTKAPLERPPRTRREWDVLLDLGARLLRHRGGVVNSAQSVAMTKLRGAGPARVLDMALRVGPHALSLSRLQATPHGVDLGPLSPCLPGRLPRGRIDLAPDLLVGDLRRLKVAVDDGSLAPTDRLLLVGRRDLRSNNSWMHNSARLMKGRSRCTLLVNPQDARAMGLVEGGLAWVRSAVGQVQVPVQVDPDIMPGVVSLPHGFGHGREGSRQSVAAAHAGVSANDLTDPAVVDELTGNAVFNGVPVTVQAVEIQPASRDEA